MSADDTSYSRRAFLAAAGIGITAAVEAVGEPGSPSSLSDVDFAKVLSRADLIYDRPVPRSEEGIPVGNGRMGSLLSFVCRAETLEIFVLVLLPRN